ncbi:MAG TPA: DUF885 domain-containing protein, partial [Candidatus Bathyarchaeia archaeon]|nr:DUF885 domain-containing protein [Candidatus Bathyarchaeia archaeon]
ERNPDLASILGLHDPYDCLLPKGDTAKVLEDLNFLKKYMNRMRETFSLYKLNGANRVDWEVLEAAVEMTDFEVNERRQHELNPDAFSTLGGAFFLMLTNDYAPLEKRIEAVISRMQKLPQYMKEFRSRFENTKPVKLWTEVALESAQQFPGFFTFVIQASKGRISDALYGKLEKAEEALMEPFHEHLAWLQNLKVRTTDEWALGREKFEKLIRLRRLGMSSEEILQLGHKYLSELKAERAKIAAEISPGGSVEEVMKAVEAKSPKTFEEALDATRRAMEDAKRFIVEKDLATVYEEDKLIVEETPAFIAPLIPFAALYMPSRFDKPMIGVYMVTRPKDAANMQKHLNFASISNTAVHEAFPGHFLQGSVSNRSSLMHQLAGGTETTEGWAHYCEQMMLERGFLCGLEARLIQVTDAIMRAVRIILDVKLSRGEMGFKEAVDMLVKEASLSSEAAISEVRRYTQSPGYPLSYLLGKHLILQLREEIKNKMGEKFIDKFFNDTMTANGYLPMAIVRNTFEPKTA